MRPKLGEGVEVGIHVHDDAGCGVANSLAAVREGARLVQGTINGYGERCGNANLTSILPALQLKMGFEVVSPSSWRRLTETVHFVDELCNLTPNPDAPYVGRNAFAHKGGMHVAGIEADARTFEHIDPAAGRQPAQRPALRALRQGDDPRPGRAGRAGDRRRGGGAGDRAAEGARAPTATTTRRRRPPSSCCCAARPGVYKPLFKLESFRVVTEKRAGGEVETEATIKVEVDGERYVRVAEGNGPVNALDRALRGAIADRYPHLAEIELTNYKVRILDEAHGTGAVTRVLLDSADGEREWGTIGVSENIIEASWEALVDSLEYAFQRATGEIRADPAGAAGDRSRARRSWSSRCCARAGSRWARWASASSASSPPGSGSRTRSRSPAAPPPCTSGCGRSAGARATRC